MDIADPQIAPNIYTDPASGGGGFDGGRPLPVNQKTVPSPELERKELELTELPR